MPLKRFHNPDLPLSELMEGWPETRQVFFRHQMLCVDCPVGPFHTVRDACLEYGLNIDTFYEELRATISLPPLLRIV